MPSPSAQTKHFLSSTKLKLLTTKILFMAKKANFAFNFIAKNRFHWFQQSLSFAYNLIAKKSISSITPENLIVKKISSWLNRSILHSIWLLQNQFHRFQQSLSFPYNLIAKKKNNFIDYTRKFDRKKFFVHGLTVQFCIQFDC